VDNYQLNKLYNEDCLPAMKQFPDKYFDLAMVDPPYGINVNHSMGRRSNNKKSVHKRVNWDNESPPQEYFDELFRISKNQIIWGANHFINKMPFASPCWIVWDKLFSEDVSFASAELAQTSFQGTTKIFKKTPLSQSRIHPTQKPIELYEWCLRKYAKKGDKILDTHLGSASSIIACKKLGFEYMGFEIDKQYFEDAQKRINEYFSQTSFLWE